MPTVQEWNRALLADDNYWDQNAFNDLMNRGAKQEEEARADRLFWCALPAALCLLCLACLAGAQRCARLSAMHNEQLLGHSHLS